MKDISQKPKSLWMWMKENANVIVAICAIVALVVSIVALIPRANPNEKGYVSKRPNVRIKPVYFKTIPYQEAGGTKSYALKFFIPIRNEGDATAYEVEIEGKELDLVRGHFNFKDEPSLRSIHTNAPFKLESGKAIEDTIFIDESPTGMDQILNGKKPITVEYKILFYADKKPKKDPFVYEYKARISFKEGKFQYEIVHERMHQEISS